MSFVRNLICQLHVDFYSSCVTLGGPETRSLSFPATIGAVFHRPGVTPQLTAWPCTWPLGGTYENRDLEVASQEWLSTLYQTPHLKKQETTQTKDILRRGQ